MSKYIFIGIIIVVAVIGFAAFRFFGGERIQLPRGEPKEEKIVTETGEENEIFVTGGVKHSIPLDEIISGGPPKDGIPSIDQPKFVSSAEASQWLKDTEPGIAFSSGNTHRFYPYQILVWHEIVNDTVAGERVLVTYCPLCLTGFVFDPLVCPVRSRARAEGASPEDRGAATSNGVKCERVEFGTSGKLWKSNLVMYDRKTDSLWSQILGEAVVGEVTGAKLKLLESDQIRFGEWRQKFPQGEVLSRDTGATRFYGTNPYGDYFAPTDFAVSIAKSGDTRLSNDAFVFGVVVNGKAKAYSTEAVKAKGEAEDSFQGTTILLRHEKDTDVIRMYKKFPDGTLERINPFSAFWFSWVAVHPDTELWK